MRKSIEECILPMRTNTEHYSIQKTEQVLNILCQAVSMLKKTQLLLLVTPGEMKHGKTIGIHEDFVLMRKWRRGDLILNPFKQESD